MSCAVAAKQAADEDEEGKDRRRGAPDAPAACRRRRRARCRRGAYVAAARPSAGGEACLKQSNMIAAPAVTSVPITRRRARGRRKAARGPTGADGVSAAPNGTTDGRAMEADRRRDAAVRRNCQRRYGQKTERQDESELEECVHNERVGVAPVDRAEAERRHAAAREQPPAMRARERACVFGQQDAGRVAAATRNDASTWCEGKDLEAADGPRLLRRARLLFRGRGVAGLHLLELDVVGDLEDSSEAPRGRSRSATAAAPARRAARARRSRPTRSSAPAARRERVLGRHSRAAPASSPRRRRRPSRARAPRTVRRRRRPARARDSIDVDAALDGLHDAFT